MLDHHAISMIEKTGTPSRYMAIAAPERMDLVGDPLQDTCHARAPKILITRIRKILYVGYRRIFP